MQMLSLAYLISISIAEFLIFLRKLDEIGAFFFLDYMHKVRSHSFGVHSMDVHSAKCASGVFDMGTCDVKKVNGPLT
jgi:hypothetical protein